MTQEAPRCQVERRVIRPNTIQSFISICGLPMVRNLAGVREGK